MHQIYLYLSSVVVLRFVMVKSQFIEKSRDGVNYIEDGSIFVSQADESLPGTGYFRRSFRVYCYHPKSLTLLQFFETVHIDITIDTLDYDVYTGKSLEEVQQKYREHRTHYHFSLIYMSPKSLQLSPFEFKCVGIDAARYYRLDVICQLCNFYRVGEFFAGILIYIIATPFSGSRRFRYAVYVLCGIPFSGLLFVFLISRLISQRIIQYSILYVGWTVCFVMIWLTLQDLPSIIRHHKIRSAFYLLGASLLQIVILFFMGTPRGELFKRCVEIIFKIIGLYLIDDCSHFKSITRTIMVAMVFGSLARRNNAIMHNIRKHWWRSKPPQAQVDTRRNYTEEALNNLRTYVNSDECNQILVMARLNNKTRFADFMKGGHHLTPEELAYADREQTRSHRRRHIFSLNRKSSTSTNDDDSDRDSSPLANHRSKRNWFTVRDLDDESLSDNSRRWSTGSIYRR